MVLRCRHIIQSPRDMTEICLLLTIIHVPKPINIYCCEGFVPLYGTVGIQILIRKPEKKKSLLSIKLDFIGE